MHGAERHNGVTGDSAHACSTFVCSGALLPRNSCGDMAGLRRPNVPGVRPSYPPGRRRIPLPQRLRKGLPEQQATPRSLT